jgi:peptidoglycan-associated lipoprotein
MKSVSKKVCFILLSAAAVLAGCSHKPMRPDPGMTGPMGPTTGGPGAVSPESVVTPTDLSARDGMWDQNGQDRTTLQADAVFFDFDKSFIKAAERPKLQAVKAYLDKNPQGHVLLEGHCDWRGTAEYNLALGDRRASEAKKYLISLGVSADKLDTLSKGSEEAKKNADKETAAHDRRVDVIVMKPGAPMPMPSSAAAPAPASGATPPPMP